MRKAWRHLQRLIHLNQIYRSATSELSISSISFFIVVQVPDLTNSPSPFSISLLPLSLRLMPFAGTHPRILVGHQKRPPGDPQAALGLSVGCFMGAGYGLFVGFGTLRPLGRNTALVMPDLSATPFAYDGSLAGAFCGATLGAGFASAVAVHLGYSWSILADLLPSRDVAVRRAPGGMLAAWLRRRMPALTRPAVRAAVDVPCPSSDARP